MKKYIIVINGRGGCGKDTLCDIAAKYYNVLNVSSITPIKNIAAEAGWDGTKDPKSRKFLSDLKQLFTDYNDLPTNYVVSEAKKFANNETQQVMFVHIREGSEIKKFVDKCNEMLLLNDFSGKIFVRTLLVVRQTNDYENSTLGNASDDNVTDYNYDLTFINDAENLEVLEKSFIEFFKNNF